MNQVKIDGKWYEVTEESKYHVVIILSDGRSFIVPKKNIQNWK